MWGECQEPFVPLGIQSPLLWQLQLFDRFFCLTGSGVALMSNFEQLLRGVWKPDTNEILHMSL